MAQEFRLSARWPILVWRLPKETTVFRSAPVHRTV